MNYVTYKWDMSVESRWDWSNLELMELEVSLEV